ncbi:F-BAR and double SH3 domains protein 1 [Liparis tanakae]|uniref:F-BAR and double SH3 domains protein 1 n=1 Tax=Liparis tanakae TaxID=230148 RepID=A0A4Z2HG38_9TELE|nr:F-BAR and double SH3 domains protein 1 [Liparis tanakae]
MCLRACGCICTCLRVCTCVCSPACTCVRACLCVYVRVYVRASLCVCLRLRVRVCVYVYLQVKESQQVKLLFSEQLSKLQTKQHQDTELLEEIRTFSKQRAAIEKEYGQGLEQLQRVQGEVVDALQELHGIKKSYHQLSHNANVAREKAADAQTRARKSEHGIFHFKTGIHKMTTKQMDGDVYDDLRSHFTLLCETEMDTCLAVHKLYSTVWESVAKVTRERNVLQFLQESIFFSKIPEFTFQPASHDKVSSLQEVCASEAEGWLVKEAKKWATKAAKDYKIITHGERALQMLERRLKLLSGETGFSVEQKIAEVQDSVRKAKLSKVKAEARLALMSNSVTGIELWLHNAMNQAEEELERERHLSEQRKSTEDFSVC